MQIAHCHTAKGYLLFGEQLQFVATSPGAAVSGRGGAGLDCVCSRESLHSIETRGVSGVCVCVWVPPVALRPPAAYHCGTGSGRRRKGTEREKEGRGAGLVGGGGKAGSWEERLEGGEQPEQ